jgi:alkylation response protein AidB-like acyl-CoA dehydrogenase
MAVPTDPAGWWRLTADEPGYDPRWWVAQLRDGRLAGGFPADAGGRGSFGDLVAVIAELAAAGIPSPVHNGLVQSGFALAELGEAARPLLRALLDGSRRFAFCLVEPDGGYRPEDVTTRAVPGAGGWVLDGTKCYVPHAGSADVLLVVARTVGGLGLFAVEATSAGVSSTPIPTLGGDRQRAVVLSGAPGALLGRPDGARDALAPALARARIALAADLAGAARAAMLHAVDRVRSREQWGAPLGVLQAVKQHCADMLIDLTQAEGAVRHAAGLVDAGEDAGLAAAAAKALCAQRCRRVSAVAHQLCGGEGIHADNPVHVWYRRIKAAEPVLGSPRLLRGVVAAALLDD